MQELSLNVLDIAQNSVRAGARLIQISVEEDHPSDRMVIEIADDGCGMTEEQIAHVTDPFFTTRTTRKVGLGVPFFKMAAEMTGGSFSIRSRVGEGTVVRAVFGLSHIDRMPLGDMADTMCCLIGCNPDLDFVYRHRVDNESFEADSRQFREILEDVPLNTPQVIQFIREYIGERLENISGGKS
ncbi:MAG: ATP-binding protein [Oscillospiraceae bacterium]|nr:ATP-binding protein [Oscillospiraceae bacterium]